MSNVFSYNIIPRISQYGSAKCFKVRVHIKQLGESHTVHDLTSSTTVRQLKEKIEGVTGIPALLQQLYFLDRCGLIDDQTLASFDILPNSRLSLRLFSPWQDVVVACCKDDIEKLECLLPLNKENLSFWDQFYLYVAAFVASHRGSSKVLERLLKTSVNLKRVLPTGRHPLLVSVQQKQLKCTEIILGRRIRAHEWKKSRESLHNWKIQEKIKANYDKAKKTTEANIIQTRRLTASQMYDSSLPTWLQGPLSRRYLCIVLDGTTPAKNRQWDRPVFRP